MEEVGLSSSQGATLPPIETGSSRKLKKSKSRKTPALSERLEPKILESAGKSKQHVPKDLSAAHPAMIGINMQSLHPFSSELIDGLYKRPVVVSILIPKKKSKSFKYEPSNRAPSPTNAGSMFEDSDGNISEKVSRPSSRGGPKIEKKRVPLKVFVVKVYDLVESKEGVYPVVVRDYDKLLEELIQEEGSTAVCDYYQPQSLDWWAKALRHVLITFDKPNGELSVAVDKKLIRKMVTYNMTHHVWMKNNLSPEQIKAQRKQNANTKKLSKSPPKRNSGTALEMGMIMQELPWNDFTAKGERNPPPIVRAGSALSSAGSSGRHQTGSAKSLPPVSHPRSPTAKTFEVGDWVQVNFKRAGQLFPGLVKKVHNNGECYDIDYDDGRTETRVEAKLVRRSSVIGRVSAQFDSVDMLASTDFENSVDDGNNSYHEPSHVLEQSTDSAYDTNYNSTYEGQEEGDSQVQYEQSYDGSTGYDNTGYDNSSYDNTGYDSANYYSTAYDSTYEAEGNAETTYAPAESTEYSATDYAEQPAEGEADAANQEPTEGVYPNEAYAESDYPIEGDQLADTEHSMEKEDYNNHAYDYTNQLVIEEDSYAQNHMHSPAVPDATESFEVSDSAELTQYMNNASKSTKEVVTDYVCELIEAVVQSSSKPSTAATSHRNVDINNVDNISTMEREENVPRPESPVQMYDPTSHYEYTQKAASQSATTYVAVVTVESSPPAQELMVVTSHTNKSNSPSQVALRSLLQTLALEESSLEGNATGDDASPTAKTSKKKKKSKKGSASKGLGQQSSTSLILLDAESAAEDEPSTSGSGKPPTTSQKVKGKFKSLQTPEGLFPEPGNQRVKTANGDNSRHDNENKASGPQPPSVEEYVARAAVSPPKKRAVARPKSMSQKSKKVKSKSAKTVLAEAEAAEAAGIAEAHAEKKVVHGNGLAKLGKPPTAPVRDLHAGVTYEEDHHSTHSHHSHHTFHSYGTLQGRGPNHHGPDAHGVFDHSDLPHYPFPQHTRDEATQMAIAVIHKPHNLPADRYTYVMVPPPEHLLHPHGHGHGHGHGNHHHSSNVHDNRKAHEGEMSPLDGANTPVGGHGHSGHSDHSGYHSTHTGHSGQSHHSHHSHPSVVHHSAPFEVRDIKDHTLVHHHHDFNVHLSTDPALFSETFPAPTFSAARSPVSNRRAASNVMSPTSSSLPSLPQINRPASRSRPTSSSVNGGLQAHLEGQGRGSALNEHTVSTISAAGTNRPMSKSKAARAVTPFTNKDQYRGPQRRVLDIIEWARVSTGGSPKRQNRKISQVEKRLLKSPLARKLIVDSPLDVASLMDSAPKR